MNTRSLVLLLCGAVGLAAQPSVARACGGGAGRIAARKINPPTWVTTVPLNAELWVFYQGTFDPVLPDATRAPGPDITLKAPDGTLVPVTATAVLTTRDVSVIKVKPDALLAPKTTYQVLDRYPVVPCDLAACTPGEPQMFATVTTGTGEDHMAPPFLGIGLSKALPPVECTESGCCGPYRSVGMQLTWQPPWDDVAQSALVYKVYRVMPGNALELVRAFPFPPPIQVAEQGGIHSFHSTVCSGQRAGIDEGPPFFGPYLARAVDWAGNEDANEAAVSFPDLCLSSPAGTGGSTGATGGAGGDRAGTGGAGASHPTTPGGGAGGCSVAVEGHRTVPASALLASLAFLLRRVRRRR